MRFLSTFVAVAALARGVLSLSSSLTYIDKFQSVSPDVAMYVYVPANVNPNAAVVVAIHSCERTAGYYFENTGYASLADNYGYMVIFPNSSALDDCWDTGSPQTMTHYGGGHSQAIADMVTYASKNYDINQDRVFVTGSSSGGIMVNLVSGLYPEIFRAASVFSGEYAYAIWPYSGTRTNMLIWHGTVDQKYLYPQFGIELDGWSQVLGLKFSHNLTDNPAPGYTKMIFGDGSQLVGISAAGVGHTVPVDSYSDLAWFGIFPERDLGGGAFSTSSSSSSTSSTSSSSSSTSSSAMTTSSSSSAAMTSSSAAAASTTAAMTSASDTAASETSTPTPSSTPAPPAAPLSTGAKAGIGAGSGLAALAVVAAALFLIRKRRQDPNQETEMAMAGGDDDFSHHTGYGALPQAGHSSQNLHMRSMGADSMTNLVGPGGMRPVSEVPTMRTMGTMGTAHEYLTPTAATELLSHEPMSPTSPSYFRDVPEGMHHITPPHTPGMAMSTPDENGQDIGMVGAHTYSDQSPEPQRFSFEHGGEHVDQREMGVHHGMSDIPLHGEGQSHRMQLD